MDKYGLIGYPLGHSFSRGFFNEKFQNEGIDAVYHNFEIPDVKQIINVVAENPDLKGLNVTIPYKQQVIPYLDGLSPEAHEMGAVNVIKVVNAAKGKTQLIGYNSDSIGFRQSIEPLLQPHHTHALILGTGGASQAVNYVLGKLGLICTFVSRTAATGRLTYADLTPEVMARYTVIVNCSPVGMFPHTEACPTIPYELINHRHLLYDLIYNPDTTTFMKKGAAQGAIVKNGLEMLLLQAYAAWDIWNNQ